MTPSQRAIEAAARALYQRSDTYPQYALRQMNDLLAADLAEAALTAALAVDGLCLVEIGSLSEHKLGVAWFQRTFGVPLGDKPSGKKSDEILSLIAAANDGEDSPPAGTEG